MLIVVDRTSADPLFAQVAAGVRTALWRDGLAPGTRLPSAKDLAATLDVNLHTVLKAYQLLRDESLIELRRGRGAVVTARATDLAGLRASVDQLVDEARRLDVDGSTVLSLVKEALA